MNLHHVTAITADAQANVDFYCGVLGLRLVKRTVNFDDPGSYHLYYGDQEARPGSIMTFFAWQGAPPGRVGPPQVTAVCFAVPSLDGWSKRLPDAVEGSRFGQRILTGRDPDGMAVELVEGPLALHSVTLSEEGHEATARLLTGVMGLRQAGSEGNRYRYAGEATAVDLLCVPDAPRGRLGAGVVHHVAFRTPEDASQVALRERLVGLGYNVSPVMDRQYFHSIYYREPGGVLFEVATDPPGFTADEPLETLGSALKLPPWLEPRRAEIERTLPPLQASG